MSLSNWLQKLRLFRFRFRRPVVDAVQKHRRPVFIALLGFLALLSLMVAPTDASFITSASYPAAPYASSVAVGDFNGDGIPDLAVAYYGTFPDFTDASVSVLLANGDGSFQPPQSYRVGPKAVSVAAGDFNGDGKLDLVTANAGTMSVRWTVMRCQELALPSKEWVKVSYWSALLARHGPILLEEMVKDRILSAESSRHRKKEVQT